MIEVQLVGECLWACLCLDKATRMNFFMSSAFLETTRHILNIYNKRRMLNGVKQRPERKARTSEELVREINVDGETESFQETLTFFLTNLKT